MAWPANITRVPVVHSVVNFDGDPIVGTARFDPPNVVLSDTSVTPPAQVAPSSITGVYDATGALKADNQGTQLDLPALNDPDVLPTGGRFKVTLDWKNATPPAPFYIDVDWQSTGIDLSTVVHQPGPSDGIITIVPGDASNFQAVAEKGQPDGYAGLDGTGKVPAAQLPSGTSGVPAGTSGEVVSYDSTGTPVAVDPATGLNLLTQTAADGRYVELNSVGVASGVASLDASGLVPTAQIPAGVLSTVRTVADQPPDPTTGNVAITPANIGAASTADLALKADATGTLMVARVSDGSYPDRPTAGTVIWVETLPSTPEVPAGMINGDVYIGPDGMAGLAAGATP